MPSDQSDSEVRVQLGQASSHPYADASQQLLNFNETKFEESLFDYRRRALYLERSFGAYAVCVWLAKKEAKLRHCEGLDSREVAK